MLDANSAYTPLTAEFVHIYENFCKIYTDQQK